MSKIPSLLNKSLVFQALIALFSVLLLSGCGVIGLSGACPEIRKKAEENRGIGIAMLDSVREGRVGEGITEGEVTRKGAEYLLQGLRDTVANPKCFSKEEVEQAEMLLNQIG